MQTVSPGCKGGTLTGQLPLSSAKLAELGEYPPLKVLDPDSAGHGPALKSKLTFAGERRLT